jgi:hypothetical protein
VILAQSDPRTGLPTITESRKKRECWRALPRMIRKQAEAADKLPEGTPWYPKHHEWNGHILQRVRCWKCGTDLKGWRAMLQSQKIGFNTNGIPVTYAEANLVMIAGKPAVALLPLPHWTSTPIGVRWPVLKKTGVFMAQHCADCEITSEHAAMLMMCFLAGTDANLWNAWNHQSASLLSPDRWATYLYRWATAEPIGILTPEEATMAERVPAPGELITAAQYIVDVDGSQRGAMPSGVVVDFEGAEIPPGWIAHPKKAKRIIKL